MRRTRPQGDAGGRRRQPRGGGLGDQAAVVLALLGPALAGCAIPKEVNPVYIYREVSGLSDEGRPPPPGLEQPFPNLAVVPPRPERPPLDLREAISAGLAADRAGSREPQAVPPGGGRGAAAAPPPGGTALPAGPPPRPALARAPVVPWTERAPRTVAPGGRAPDRAVPAGGVAAPVRPAQPASPIVPGVAAPAPTPGAPAPSAPPPPPSRDLLGLPPLASPDPSGPPPPPSLDLLAPPR